MRKRILFNMSIIFFLHNRFLILDFQPLLNFFYVRFLFCTKFLADSISISNNSLISSNGVFALLVKTEILLPDPKYH